MLVAVTPVVAPMSTAPAAGAGPPPAAGAPPVAGVPPVAAPPATGAPAPASAGAAASPAGAAAVPASPAGAGAVALVVAPPRPPLVDDPLLAATWVSLNRAPHADANSIKTSSGTTARPVG